MFPFRNDALTNHHHIAKVMTKLSDAQVERALKSAGGMEARRRLHHEGIPFPDIPRWDKVRRTKWPRSRSPRSTTQTSKWSGRP